MIVLKVEPGKAPERMEITGDLESMQKVVGGSIQAIYPFDDPVAMICHDEGKLIDLPLNRALRGEDGKIYDVIAGTLVLCGAPPEEENFANLTEAQLEKYEALFHTPEVFIRMEGTLVCIPLLEQ